MTRPSSQINYSSINASYPVAGQDNNSQGFRDNFSAISAGLEQAATEISALQQNVVLIADLTTNATLTNSLLGSTISNGSFIQFNPVVYNLGTISTSGGTVDLNNGPVQTASLSGNGTLTLQDWSASGTYSSIKLIVTGTGASSVTLANSTSTTFKAATGFAGTVAVGGGTATYPITTGKTDVLELWTTDAGLHIYIKLAGEY